MGGQYSRNPGYREFSLWFYTIWYFWFCLWYCFFCYVLFWVFICHGILPDCSGWPWGVLVMYLISYQGFNKKISSRILLLFLRQCHPEDNHDRCFSRAPCSHGRVFFCVALSTRLWWFRRLCHLKGLYPACTALKKLAYNVRQAPFPQFSYPAFHLPIWEGISVGKTPHINLTILTSPWTWSFIRVLERPYRGINTPYWLVPYYYLNICPPVAPRHSHRDKNLTNLVKSHGCWHNSLSWVWPFSIFQLGRIFLALHG